MASRPLVAVPTTWIFGSGESISETRRRKNPESSTTRTLTAINTPRKLQKLRRAVAAGKRCEASQTRRPRALSRPLGPPTSAREPGPLSARTASHPPRVALEHARHIENQGDASIAGDGGAGHARRALQHLAQGLDHHLFLTDPLVDHRSAALGGRRR